MTDTTTLSGPLLDYYAALAENMPNPRLVKHQRDDTYICIYDDPAFGYRAVGPLEQLVSTLRIIQRLVYAGINPVLKRHRTEKEVIAFKKGIVEYGESSDLTEAALRALVAWKFPDGLPEPVYESEK